MAAPRMPAAPLRNVQLTVTRTWTRLFSMQTGNDARRFFGEFFVKKSAMLLACSALAAAACNDEPPPGFDRARYVLTALAGKPLPAGPAHQLTLADTLVITPSEGKGQQTLVYVFSGAPRRVVTELGLFKTDRGYQMDFHCISDMACTAMSVPEYGTVRGDTLQFVDHGGSPTRTYLRR